MTTETSNRKKLLAIMAVFAAPVIVAAVLVASGWRPIAARNHGALIQPPIAFTDVRAQTDDGAAIDWNTADGIWHVLVLPPRGCAAPCAEFADTLRRVRLGLNQGAARVAVLYVATPDDPGVAGALAAFPQMRRATLVGAHAPNVSPQARSPVVYLVDPNGYLVMHYEQGFDLVGLRTDLKRLLK